LTSTSDASSPAVHKGDFGQSGFDSALALGRTWEPDWLLLKPDAQGAMRLWAGCVCFPSSWALEEKMGRPIDFIHAPVPGLNESLGAQIDGFLRRMKPGISWLRENWGLSRWPDLNQHPARGLRRLDAGVSLAEVWLRVEYQALVALPESQGVLFGIRVAAHPLAAVKADATAAAGLARALKTMPDAMAAYKGLASSRERIVQLLEG
jgi:dimethylamine monooxygenase subunit A